MSNFSQIGLSHWSTIIVSYYSNTGTRDLVALFWPAPQLFPGHVKLLGQIITILFSIAIRLLSTPILQL